MPFELITSRTTYFEMKKTLKVFFTVTVVLASLLLSISACQKSDEDTPPDTPVDEEIQENVTIIEENDAELLSDSAQLLSGTYVFKFNGAPPSFSENDVFVSKAGIGHLRKINTVSSQGNTLTLQTEQATLEDLYKNSKVSFDIPFSENSLKSGPLHALSNQTFLAAGVEEVQGDGINLSLSNVVLKVGSDEFDINAKLENATVNIVPNFDYTHKIVDGSLQKLIVSSYNTPINFDYHLSASGTANATHKYEQVLYEKHQFTVVGLMLIYIKHEVRVEFQPKASVGIDCNYQSTTESIYDLAMAYENGSFGPVFEQKSETSKVTNSTMNVRAGGELKLSLIYEPKFLVFGVLGPYMENSLFANATGNINSSQDWDFNIGMGVDSKLGIKFEVFSKDIGDVSKTFNLYSASLLEAPKNLQLISGNNQEGSVGAQLPQPIKFQVTDNVEGSLSGVPVYFEVTEGGGSLSMDVVQTDEDGFAEVMWTMGDQETQKLEAKIKNGSGALIGSPKPANATTVAADYPICFKEGSGIYYSWNSGTSVTSQNGFQQNLNGWINSESAYIQYWYSAGLNTYKVEYELTRVGDELVGKRYECKVFSVGSTNCTGNQSEADALMVKDICQ